MQKLKNLELRKLEYQRLKVNGFMLNIIVSVLISDQKQVQHSSIIMMLEKHGDKDIQR